MAKILLVEDDEPLALTIEKSLTVEHYTVERAVDGEEGWARLIGSDFDLVILDWNLPGRSGLSICREYRERGGSTPILMLTGKTAIHEKEAGFESGADDYLTKPFSMRELSVRIKALMRRPPKLIPKILQVGDIRLDPVNFNVWRGEQSVQLMPIDFALLEFLMRNPNSTFSQDALIQRVWHSDKDATSDSLRSAIRRIRQKLDDDSGESIIETIPRVGYRLRS